ncbi:MAG: hypothetical protein V3U76_09515 [Granulosicoccus sp.]
MNASKNMSDIAKLLEIHVTREKRTLRDLQIQREQYSTAERKCSERQALVDGLTAQMSVLSTSSVLNSAELSSDMLAAEVAQRRWLRYDLDAELYYMISEKSNLRKLSIALRKCQREWQEARQRLNSLTELHGTIKQTVARNLERLEDTESTDNHAATLRFRQG